MKYESSLKAKLIYVFRINGKAHAGCLKIGEATLDSFSEPWTDEKLYKKYDLTQDEL